MKCKLQRLWKLFSGHPARRRQSSRQSAESLESRELLTVTWNVNAGVLTLTGNSAPDSVSVIVSDKTVYFNGTDLRDASGRAAPGVMMIAANSVTRIDVSGGSGNDTIEFTQAGDFQKPVRLFGQDGNDTLRVIFLSGRQALVLADGGLGSDTANVPANIGTGRFSTNAELGSFGTIAGAGVNPALRATAFVAADSSNRSAALSTRIIQQFSVQNNSRYIDPNKTFCNIFAWDVTSAMGAEIPHWVDANDRPAEPLAQGARELNVNSTVSWLEQKGASYGWKSTTAPNAQSFANSGRPVIAIWRNPTGSYGHIAVVRPTSQAFDANQGPAIAQAGGFNGANNTESTFVRTGFGVGGSGPAKLSDVRYYYY